MTAQPIRDGLLPAAWAPEPKAAAPGDAAAFLHTNDAAYRWAVARCQRIDADREPEAALAAVARAAGVAGAFHAGRFADGALENIALHIGQRLARGHGAIAGRGAIDLAPATARPLGRRRVLHLATQLVGIAGHARMLDHWVRHDPGSCHSLVVTGQPPDQAVPDWLSASIAGSGGALMVLRSRTPLLAKAQWLRATARRGADLVVLHHDGHDVLPTVAFATADGPPVVVLNHADHQFWLGTAVADAAIHLRTPAVAQAAARRGIRRNLLLPVPLTDVDAAHQHAANQRQAARHALGIAPDELLLLSVGRAVKYQPCGTHDFVATAGRLLDRVPRARLVVVGATLAGIAPLLRAPPHPRLQFAGAVDDASAWRAAADVYLESFPFGSQTALLEAALAGLPVVPACAPLCGLLVAHDDALHDLLPNPPDEAAYIARAVALASDATRRAAFGATLRQRLLADHLGTGWQARLQDIYRDTDALRHRPRPVAQTACQASADDIGLSLWHVAADGRHQVPNPPGATARAAAAHGAYVARIVGDVAGARRQALRALRHAPWAPDAWVLLGITLLGKQARRLRQWLQQRRP